MMKGIFYFVLGTVNGRVYIIRNKAGRLAQSKDYTLGPATGAVFDSQKWRIVMEPSKPGYFYIINYYYGFYIIKYGAGFKEVSAPDATKSDAGLWRLSKIDNPMRL